MKVTALAGGVGAAKFLRGLVQVVDPAEVTVIGNTGDDATFHGLHVSPDLDIVTYTLAGIVDEELGWGVRDDTTNALEQMAKLGIDTWFTLRDRDLGTHLARTTWLLKGIPLSSVAERIRTRLGVGTRILPMTNDKVRTKIVTAAGVEREFQEYFVKYRYAEEVEKIKFEGAKTATPAPGVIEAIHSADRIIVCPSNPVVSIGPILSIRAIRDSLRENRERVFAVTPIVEGRALRGPADRLLPAVGAEPSAEGVAAMYKDFAGAFVLDYRDAPQATGIEEMGMKVLVLDTIMESPPMSKQLAKEILSF